MLVDVPLAHLDRPFDYAVPEAMADDAQPGVRVKVRFAGQDVDGFVLERAESSEHTGRLQPLRRVVSAEPVLSAEVAELTAAVAARYAGTRSDVLRLAVPSRHAPTEKQPSEPRAGDRGAPRPRCRGRLRPRSRAARGARPRRVAARRVDGAARRRLGRRSSRRPSPRRRRAVAARWCAPPTTATSPGSTPR